MAGKVRVTVVLPTMLVGSTDGQREVEIEASTLRGCLDALVEGYPLLEVHLFDELGEIRPHVNIFYNETNVRWIGDWGMAVRGGDRLTVLQAVSGG